MKSFSCGITRRTALATVDLAGVLRSFLEYAFDMIGPYIEQRILRLSHSRPP